jgi:hypothetical protein
MQPGKLFFVGLFVCIGNRFTFVKTNKMINVTIGESKAHEKPFPKLMKTGNWITLISEINSDGKGIGIHILGAYSGVFTTNLNMDDYVDYNEPITIQNA